MQASAALYERTGCIGSEFSAQTVDPGQSVMAAGMVLAVSIILQGKNFDFSWSPHFIDTCTLNSMAFLLLLFFVLATRRIFRALLVRQIKAKEKAKNKIMRSLPS